MPFEYFEITRRQLADSSPTKPPLSDMSKGQKVNARENRHNAYGCVREALNALGADDWELVSVVVSQDHGGELLYTFKKS